jgi:hypothetical protein
MSLSGEAKPMRGHKSEHAWKTPLTWGIHILLFGLAIPWYWPAGNTIVWLGVPGWVATAILFSVLISIFTAWKLNQAWPDSGSSGHPRADDITNTAAGHENAEPGRQDLDISRP